MSELLDWVDSSPEPLGLSRPLFARMPRPVFRYHGGKYRLARWIVEHLPPHDQYVEPFAGAASVLLAKSRARAETINDLDGEVVNVFRVLRDPKTARALRRAMLYTPFSRAEFDAAYECRSACADLPPVERARVAILRAYLAFGGSGLSARYPTGFRTNGIRDVR